MEKRHQLRYPFPVLKFLQFGVPNRGAELARSSRVVPVNPGRRWGRSYPRYEGFRVQRALLALLLVRVGGGDPMVHTSPRQRIAATSEKADSANSLLLGLARLPHSREQCVRG